MITSWFIVGFLTILNGIFVTFSPVVEELPFAMTDSVVQVFSFLEPFTELIPGVTLLACMGVILTFEAGMMIFKAMVFMFKRMKS